MSELQKLYKIIFKTSRAILMKKLNVIISR